MSGAISDDTYTERGLHNGYTQQHAIIARLFEGRSEFQHLAVYDTATFGRMLVLDGILQTTVLDEFIYHEMLVHVPMFTHPSPRQVLIIGGGDGGSAREALKHPSVERVVMVELDPKVVEVSRDHLPELSAGAFDDPRLTLLHEDGAAYVATTEETFDAIIVDSSDPIGPAEVLFQERFYADCAARLSDGAIIATQSGVAMVQPEEVTEPYKHLRAAFAHAGFYRAAVPTYLGGDMAFGWAGGVDAAAVERDVIAARIAERGLTGLRAYDADVHKATFALPPWIRALMRR